MGDVAHELRTTKKEIEYMKGSYSSTAGPGSPVFPGAAAMAKSEAGEAIKKYIDGLQATDPMEGAINSWLIKGGGGGGGGSGVSCRRRCSARRRSSNAALVPEWGSPEATQALESCFHVWSLTRI